ncbi:hypothetical protein ACFLT1_02045 [Bacteroidota bacterium]
MLSKITTIALFLSILDLCLYSQYQPGIRILDYEDSAGEKGKTTFIYNHKKVPYKAIWELKDASRWSVNYHEFSESGKLIRKYREFSDSVIIKQEYVYDHNDVLIKETFSRSDGIKGEAKYTYEDNALKYTKCKNFNGWFSGRLVYKTEAGGKLSSAIISNDSSVIGNISYIYDEKGRLSQEIWYFNQGFTQYFTYTYLDNEGTRYRSSNVFVDISSSTPVMNEEYDYNGETGGPSFYEYQEGSKLVLKTFVRSDGLKTETSFQYQPDGLLKSSKRKYANGSTGEFTYVYNKEGLLSERAFLRSDSFTSNEKYTYDEHNRLISGIYKNFDGWLSGTLIFRHDLYDRIRNASFIGDGCPDANLLFNYDNRGNLSMIHWEFNNGTTQTYTFTY